MEIHNLESDIKLIMGNLKKMEQELMRQTQVVYEVVRNLVLNLK